MADDYSWLESPTDPPEVQAKYALIKSLIPAYLEKMGNDRVETQAMREAALALSTLGGGADINTMILGMLPRNPAIMAATSANAEQKSKVGKEVAKAKPTGATDKLAPAAPAEPAKAPTPHAVPSPPKPGQPGFTGAEIKASGSLLNPAIKGTVAGRKEQEKKAAGN
jgi:hypothetical protein